MSVNNQYIIGGLVLLVVVWFFFMREPFNRNCVDCSRNDRGYKTDREYKTNCCPPSYTNQTCIKHTGTGPCPSNYSVVITNPVNKLISCCQPNKK